MGFNNRGPAGGVRAAAGDATHLHGVIGVNIGANKDSADRIADYVAGVRRMAPVADYLTINISSPNTPGLRGLQDEGALEELLAAVRGGARPSKPRSSSRSRPDLEAGDPERIVRAALDHRIDALIVANTTCRGRRSGRATRAKRAGCRARR